MKVIYAQEEFPKSFTKSLFLAGGTPRSADVQSWRPEALKILEILDFDGVVFVPEYPPGTNIECGYEWNGQVAWEDAALNMSDCILFWIPRDLEKLPCFTTNDEWGYWKSSGKIVFGCPDKAHKIRYQKYYANKFKTPVSNTLAGTLENAVKLIGDGALRDDAERKIPLMIWNTPSFQLWYSAHLSVGNYLENARLLWNYRVGPNEDRVFAYTLWVNVYVKAEERFKYNEFVFFRPDISVVVLYRKAERFEDTEVVLIKEFRSSVRNDECFIYEAPGGSSYKDTAPSQVASDETYEETGVRINPNRFRIFKSRQLAATLVSHHAHMFAAELSEEEMQKIKESADANIAFGNIEDTEQTFLRVVTVGELLETSIPLDWSMFGMVMRATL